MINDKQKKMLKRVITYSELLKYDIIAIVVTLLMWVLFMMVDDLVLGHPGVFTSGIVIMVIVCVIDCILMMIHGIYVRVATAKKDWLDMVEKARDILSEMEEDGEPYGSVAARVGISAVSLLAPTSALTSYRLLNTVALVRDMGKKKDMGTSMAALFGVDLRSKLFAKLAIVLIPISILCVAFGVRCYDAAQVKESAYAAAGPAVDALVASFSQGCEAVIGDDPYDGYDENGYSWACYLDESWTNYVRVTIDNSGLITAVDYFAAVDVDVTKEENLAIVEEVLDQMYSMVIGSAVEAETDQLLDEPILTDSFIESFIEGSYYENISEKTDTLSLYYFTDDEEDYEDSYLRISMEGR